MKRESWSSSPSHRRPQPRRLGATVIPLIFRRAVLSSRLDLYNAIRRACRDPRLALQIAIDALDRDEIKAGDLTAESKHWLVSFLAEGLSMPAEVFDHEAPRQSISSELQGRLLRALEGEHQNLSA